MKASAIGRGLHCQAAALAGSLEDAVADVDAARPELRKYRPVAAVADIERRPEEAAMMVVAPMTATPMAATVHAMTTSRSGGNSGSGQSERGDSCERDFAKQICILHFARRDCLMR